ncbi:S1C family serine protease [Nocardioides dongkuii]|uniref:S1C family serine protease n=1 Tax=Nocardioides dongkuii TaxID=2760089 RepID=UPI0015FAA770|nr:trypsin-like peptidase domain-containing protein [Nocardioides dongkuii]
MTNEWHDDTQPVRPTAGEQPTAAPAAAAPTAPPTAPPTTPQPVPAPPTTPPPAPLTQPRAPRGRRFAAGVVAASLVAGGAAGLGGAAAWDAWDDDPTGNRAGTPSRSTAQFADSDSDSEPATDGTVESVAASVLPSVVKIDVTGAQGSGSGSGVVLSEDGQVLTNDHVVELAGDGGEITVSFNDGTEAEAEIVGTDPLTDVAVIQAEDVEGLTPITLGSSDDLEVGEGVVAIGSPFGLDATVTSGIVSALNRPVGVGQSADGTTAYPAIQTDAAINPGNSGGPLVDMEGRLVGINSSIRSTASSSPFGTSEAGSIGLGFAIPIDDAMPIVEEIVAGETPSHALLGISVSDVGAEPGTVPGMPGAEEGATPSEGALVREVGGDSAAADAGLKQGDVITKIDEQHVAGSDDLIATIRSYRPGDTVTVTYERDGVESTTELELDSDASES